MHVCDIYPKWNYKKANAVIAISEETRQWAINRLGHNCDTIYMVPHGISETYSKTLSNEEHIRYLNLYGLPHDKILIGLVGSIEKRKGHDILLEAFKTLPQDVKDRAHMVFVGGDKNKDGKNISWLHGLIEKTHTEQYVTHIDYCDPKPLYQLFDIVVLPSRLEGFPLTAIEAMMSHCCVIRTNTEGATWQINHNIDGLLFEKDNIQELSSLLYNVLSNESLRLQLADAGQKKALNKFTAGRMAEDTYNVYKLIQ